jgi:copper homeostasis protein
LELCASLHEGGTTPSAGTIGAVRALGTAALHVLVRPRGAGFVYTDAELGVMRRDIAVARSLGADGIVSGVLRADGTIDADRTSALVEWAAPLLFVFHRAFDAAPDLDQSLETLVRCGAHGVLTSGGAASALEGVTTLASLVTQAAGRLTVIAGGGVRAHNAAEIVHRTGVREVHTRPALVRQGPAGARPLPLRRPWPADEWSWEETDEAQVRAVLEALNSRS